MTAKSLPMIAELKNDGVESNLTGVNNSASTYTYNDGTSGVGEPTVNLDEGTVEISGQSGSSAFNSISNPDESTISQVDARVDPNADAGNDLEGQGQHNRCTDRYGHDEVN